MRELGKDATALTAAAQELASQTGHAVVMEEHLLIVVAKHRVGGKLLATKRLCATALVSALEARLARTQANAGYRGAIPEPRDLDALLVLAAKKKPLSRLFMPIGSRDIIAALLDSPTLRAEIEASRFDLEPIMTFTEQARVEVRRRRHKHLLAEHALVAACGMPFFREPLERAGVDVVALKRPLVEMLRNRRFVSAALPDPDQLATYACIRANDVGAVVLSPVRIIVELLGNAHVVRSLAARDLDAWELMFALCHAVPAALGEPPDASRVRVVVYHDSFTTTRHVADIFRIAFELEKAFADERIHEIRDRGRAEIGIFDLDDARARVSRARENHAPRACRCVSRSRRSRPSPSSRGA